MLDYGMRKKIEWAFYNYEVLKKRVKEYVYDIACTGVTARYEAVGGHSNCISNPTELKGISAAMQQDEAWVRVVDKTIEHFKDDPKKTKFIQYKYMKRIPVRALLVKYRDVFDIYEEKTFYNWLDEILTYAAMVAIQYRLITI
jgi:hypothetical protein